jgi:hypothetical protein
MASLVAAAPGPPPATGPASAAPDPNAGRTWRLIPDPANPQGFLLLEGRFDATRGFVKNSDISIGTNLPDIQVSQQERLGDIVKDMVGATAELERLILNEVILPAYGLQGPGNPVDFYNFLMANKLSAQTELGPYITEGIFARSSVTRKGICYVVVVVPESGDKGAPFSTRYDPSNPGSVRYLNTGAIPMDPSSSNAGGNPLVWPLIGETVYYGDDCLFRFGLPHELMWQAKTLGNNQFEYTINPQPIGMLGQPTPPRPFTSDSIPSIITEGNRARMQRFSGLLQNGSFPLGIRPEALQSTIYKEEGDLMQILEYLCFYHAGYIYNPADPDPFDSLEVGSRKKSVMVTTDEVVFKICCDLGIPCIYTGGKSVDPETGVHISGYGAYKFYNPVIDRATAFKNTIMNIFNNKKGINDVQMQLLEDIKWLPNIPKKNIYYYKQGGRTHGMRVCFRPSIQDRIQRYNEHIDRLIAGIRSKNVTLNTLKETALAGIDSVINASGIPEEDKSEEDIALENTTIAGIIQKFDDDSLPFLTQLYLDKTNGPTSVDANATSSTIYNCIDVPLCAKLTSGFGGGGKITGGRGFTQDEWEAFKQDEFNIVPHEGRQNMLTQEYPAYFITKLEDVTISECNVLLIIFLCLRDPIKKHFTDKIGLPEDAEKINNYSTVSANSICASIYSRYAYLVSLINKLPSSSEPDYNNILSIEQLCNFDSLETAVTDTLDLIGIADLDSAPPLYVKNLYASKYLVNTQGYIIRFSIGDQTDNVTPEYVSTMLSAIIFLQPDQSYNAPGLPRFTPDVASAQAAQMQSSSPGGFVPKAAYQSRTRIAWGETDEDEDEDGDEFGDEYDWGDVLGDEYNHEMRPRSPPPVPLNVARLGQPVQLSRFVSEGAFADPKLRPASPPVPLDVARLGQPVQLSRFVSEGAFADPKLLPVPVAAAATAAASSYAAKSKQGPKQSVGNNSLASLVPSPTSAPNKQKSMKMQMDYKGPLLAANLVPPTPGPGVPKESLASDFPPPPGAAAKSKRVISGVPKGSLASDFPPPPEVAYESTKNTKAFQTNVVKEINPNGKRPGMSANGGNKRTRKNKRTKTIKKSKPQRKNKTKRKNNINRK